MENESIIKGQACIKSFCSIILQIPNSLPWEYKIVVENIVVENNPKIP